MVIDGWPGGAGLQAGFRALPCWWAEREKGRGVSTSWANLREGGSGRRQNREQERSQKENKGVNVPSPSRGEKCHGVVINIHCTIFLARAEPKRDSPRGVVHGQNATDVRANRSLVILAAIVCQSSQLL